MIIGLDCRLLGKKHAGIGRYVENLAVRLPFFLPEHQFVYFFYDKTQLAELVKLLGQADIEAPTMRADDFFKKVRIVYTPIRHYTWQEQWEMPSHFEAARLDLLHIPHFNVPIFYQGKICITIFDLLWHEYKGAHVTTLSPVVYYFKYFAYKFVTKKAVQKARAIFYSAQVVKDSIVKYYPTQAHKLVFTQYGVTLPPSGNIKNGFKTKLPTLPYLLYVGSLYPHKNIKVVLEALAKDESLQLVCVGARNVFQDNVEKQVKEMGITKQVTFLGYVSDEELTYLYEHCFALVQPSLYEGFGLTGVEAMGVGAPVIASAIPIFEEIYGKAAIIFDPLSSDSFLTAIKNLETKDRQTLVQTGKNQVKKYNWNNMVHTVAKTYEKLLREP